MAMADCVGGDAVTLIPGLWALEPGVLLGMLLAKTR